MGVFLMYSLCVCVLLYIYEYKEMLGRTHTAVVCCIAKAEDRYLDEWIRYTLKLGFSRIYIYDNAAVPAVAPMLSDKPYIDKVTILHYPGRVKQIPAYNHFYMDYSWRHTWVAYIDCDEFITLVKPEPIVNFLKKHCKDGALAVSWRVFGDNGETVYTPAPVLERFTKCENAPDKHVKCITRCEDLIKFGNHFGNPHFPQLREGRLQRDVVGRATSGPFNENPTLELIYISHYLVKSYGEFIEKRNRGRADADLLREMSDFQRYNKNDIEDTRARDFMNGDLDFSI